MEYASYQQAKIAINKFDGAMTKGKSSLVLLFSFAETYVHQVKPSRSDSFRQ